MRLIDGDALLEKVWDADTRCGYVQVVDRADIENAPTIEPRKGKWIVTSKFEYCCYAKCNECKVTQVFYYNKAPNFCPNCGIEMENSNG